MQRAWPLREDAAKRAGCCPSTYSNWMRWEVLVGYRSRWRCRTLRCRPEPLSIRHDTRAAIISGVRTDSAWFSALATRLWENGTTRRRGNTVESTAPRPRPNHPSHPALHTQLRQGHLESCPTGPRASEPELPSEPRQAAAARHPR